MTADKYFAKCVITDLGNKKYITRRNRVDLL